MDVDVFCYGEIGVDNIIQVPHLPNPEKAAFPSSDSNHIGGAAANTAVWLAHFGVPTAVAGNIIGHDAYGLQLWDWLNQHPGVDLSHVVRDATAATPFCRVMVTSDGERSFLIFGYPQAKTTDLLPQHLNNCTYLSLDLYGGSERLRAAQAARQASIQTAVGDLIDPAHPIAPLASILTNSAAYIRETLPGVDILQHARGLQAVTKGVVATTNGGRAVLVIDTCGAVFTITPPRVQPVDATGAGDAFRAGLLAGLLRGQPLPRAVCWGVAAGALKVQHLGAATTLPPAADIIALADTLVPQRSGF